MLAEVDIENAQSSRRRGPQHRLNGAARNRVALSQRAETDRVRLRRFAQNVLASFDKIPRGRLLNRVGRFALWVQAYRDRARGNRWISGNPVRPQAESGKMAEDLAAQRVIANARNHQRISAQFPGMIREIRRRTAGLFSARQQIPQQLANSNDQRFRIAGRMILSSQMHQ